MSDHGHIEEFIDDLADRLGFDDVVAALAATVARPVPPAARGGLLAAIANRPRPTVTPESTPDLYARRVAAMAALLDELTESDWAAPAAPYDWTVHGLLAHLALIEEYTARQFGLTDLPPLPAGAPTSVHHLGLGADEIAEIVAGDRETTVRRWRQAAERIVGHVGGDTFEPTAAAPLHAWPFDASTALVVRAFEIWTHADDIRRATGRPLDTPSPAELRTMSSTSVGGLPALLVVVGGPPMEPTRVVLTGPGGGSFDLGGAGRGREAEHLLVVDVVDYCRLVARRIDAEDLAGHRQGDDELIDALLRAASAIAV